MCFSERLSLVSFSFGTIGSLLLYLFGNKKYSNEILPIAIFSFFFTLVQLMEYFMWKDIDCKSGWNKLMTKIRPILINNQPTVFYILLSLYLKDSNIVDKKFVILSGLIMFVLTISEFNKINDCTTLNNKGHLNWYKSENIVTLMYHVLTIMTVINFSHNELTRYTFCYLFITLLISFMHFNEVLAEFWCLFSTGAPYFTLLASYFLVR